ncbi:flotillin family protein [Alteripontixanthobacter maritimus]
MAGSVLAVLLIIAFVITRLYRRATKEVAFVRTGFRGEQVVMNGGALVLPVLHETMPVNMNTVRLAVERKNADALITLDRLRIDVKAEFYVRVRPDAGAIAMAAQTLGLRTMEPEALKDLVEGKFVDALRSVAAGMTMNQLHEQRADFVQKVQQVSSSDLAMNGLELESVSLTGLDQTSIEHFNANNAFDAEGLTKLTEQIELRKKARNDIEQDTRVQMETKNLEADQKSFEIGRDQEYARLEQEREVEVRRAGQTAEIAREQAERNREADAARIEAKKQVDAQQIEADRLVEEARIDQTRALEIARQEQQIAVQNKSREESQAKAQADEARASAVAAEEGVKTARETEVADRDKRIELIEAAKAAERDAIHVRVEAEAEKDAASNRAEAQRLEAQGEAEAEKLRADAARVRFEVEAAGQKAVNEAANILSNDQISLKTKLALLEVMPDLVRESAKPMEAIDSIKIVQVDGLTQNGGSGRGSGDGSNGSGSGSGNLAGDAVSAALAYRAQAPVLDGLMKELGLDGSSLSKLVEGASEAEAQATPAASRPALTQPASKSASQSGSQPEHKTDSEQQDRGSQGKQRQDSQPQDSGSKRRLPKASPDDTSSSHS